MTKASKIEALRARGIIIPVPEQITIGDEVVIERLHGPDTTLFPGTQLRGEALLIGPGCTLGAEGPVMVDNCALGRNVALNGGAHTGSVYLDGVSCGPAAQVRAGCLLEEEASTAHAVGLKQTLLLPFVTLGSLINFCDVLMAGGSSRDDHSEVGSSFIHFNFTPFGPRGDKATASLIGDVPRGVMLRSARIFLGGQAGLVGPVQIDFGTVLAAGFVYRRDYGPNQLVVGEPLPTGAQPFRRERFRGIGPRVAKNLRYIGELVALWHFYEQARLPWSGDRALEHALYRAAQGVVGAAIEERLRQLKRLAEALPDSIASLAQEGGAAFAQELAVQRRFAAQWPEWSGALARATPTSMSPTTWIASAYALALASAARPRLNGRRRAS
ncbi:MAG: UDP-N-acetylglucosamine pyrophosphorylase [Proteobacteria bacterium]|nr:UDP-N-acetylglucosamine pyrophosphorylase [Pseudomonadota bacterium]